MTRHVWLCTRPLKAAIGVSPLESTSKPDKPHFRHWGILVTEWTEPEFRDIIQTPQERGPIPHRTLGTMYQLRRDGKQMECLVDEDFTIEKVRDTWGKTFTAHPVGTTEMADEEIRDEGTASLVYCQLTFLKETTLFASVRTTTSFKTIVRISRDIFSRNYVRQPPSRIPFKQCWTK
jgi:hypothetical protein